MRSGRYAFLVKLLNFYAGACPEVSKPPSHVRRMGGVKPPMEPESAVCRWLRCFGAGSAKKGEAHGKSRD